VQSRCVAERAESDLVYVDKQLMIRRVAADSMSISGVIDAYNIDAFARSLYSSLDGEGDLHIDLSLLEFCDVNGIRALVAAAERVSDGRRLVLHGLPEQLRNVMIVVGWADLPGLVIGEPGETSP
jgi:anti-anti-sigma regulatory factor